jgi:hypothetical protein
MAQATGTIQIDLPDHDVLVKLIEGIVDRKLQEFMAAHPNVTEIRVEASPLTGSINPTHFARDFVADIQNKIRLHGSGIIK